MIKGIGIDLESISRVQEALDNQPAFVDRILTENEIKQYQDLPKAKSVEYLASRFSGKEAFSKAIGTGIGENVSFQEIEILNNTSGKPIISYQKNNDQYFISISHKDDYVITQVIIEVK